MAINLEIAADQPPLDLHNRVASGRTGWVESDSKDRRRAYGDGNNGRHAAPGPRHRDRRICKSCRNAEQDRRMINARDQTVLDLMLGRRGECRRTHGGLIHWAGHPLFHERHLICRHREIRQHTHRPDHPTKDENKHQRDMQLLNLSNHESNHGSCRTCSNFLFTYTN